MRAFSDSHARLQQVRIVLDLGGQLLGLGSFRQVGIRRSQRLAPFQAADVLLRAEFVAGLGEQFAGPALPLLVAHFRPKSQRRQQSEPPSTAAWVPA